MPLNVLQRYREICNAIPMESFNATWKGLWVCVCVCNILSIMNAIPLCYCKYNDFIVFSLHFILLLMLRAMWFWHCFCLYLKKTNKLFKNNIFISNPYWEDSLRFSTVKMCSVKTYGFSYFCCFLQYASCLCQQEG